MQSTAQEAALATVLRDLITRLDRARDDGLWDADDIASWMRLSKRSVQNHYISKEGFPKPVILATGGKRWVASEVKTWIMRRRG